MRAALQEKNMYYLSAVCTVWSDAGGAQGAAAGAAYRSSTDLWRPKAS